jgi:rhomboid protease GluP
MTAGRVKFKLIFIPYLIIAVGTLCVYTLFNWFFLIRNEVLLIDKEFVEFFIPAILPWPPLIIWLRPRIKYLKLKVVGRRDPVLNMLMLAWIIIGLTTGLVQSYIVKAAGKLTYLNYPSQIDKKPLTRYYKFGNFYPDKRFANTRVTAGVSGKHRENYDVTIYLTIPLLDKNIEKIPIYKSLPVVSKKSGITDSLLVIVDGEPLPASKLSYINPADVQDAVVIRSTESVVLYGKSGADGVLLLTTKGFNNQPRIFKPAINVAAWLCVMYEQRIDNNLSASQKEASYKMFLAQSQNDIHANSFACFTYLDRVSYSNDRKEFEKAVKEANPNLSKPMILVPVYEPFEKRDGNKLFWILGIIGIGSGLFLLILQFFSLRPPYYMATSKAPN